jgi:hypothetical protein
MMLILLACSDLNVPDSATEEPCDAACGVMFGEDACGAWYEWTEVDCHDRCATEDWRILDPWAECVLAEAEAQQVAEYGFDDSACGQIALACSAWPCSYQPDASLPYCPD